MTVAIIQKKLATYSPTSLQDEEFALKEISQEIALAALSRTDFFQKVQFQGGTALRILHEIERFSEDLDFLLKENISGFALEDYFSALTDEFASFGFEFSVQNRSKIKTNIQKAFLKENSLGSHLILKNKRGPNQSQIKIKLEVDINPPGGSLFETKYLDFPFPFAVTVQNLPSLFAGKIHALLCRSYTKGRDWFDFIWYVSQKVSPNFDFLKNACYQNGPWQKQNRTIDATWLCGELDKKIRSIDWNDTRNDIARFLRPNQAASLQLWNQDFFLDRLSKLQKYLLQ